MTDAFALIPLAAILAAAIFIHLHSSFPTCRQSLLAAVTLAAAWLIIGTETLSLFHALRFRTVLLWWLLPLLVLIALIIENRALFKSRPIRLPRFNLGHYAILLLIVAIAAASFLPALLSAPNTGDALSYHLPRQIFWLQRASVENYSATNLRQLAMPPFVEYAGVHLMILTGDDHAHTFIQWFAYILTMLAASLITRKFTDSPTAQLLAALVVATIPQAYLQSANTKNDMVVTLWCCVVTLWIFQVAGHDAFSRSKILLLAIAFGALILTKGTGYIFAVPLAALATMILLRFHPIRRSLPSLASIALIALALNAPFFWRTYKAFGSPVPDRPGIHKDQSLGMENHSPRALASNIIRNLGPELIAPSPAWNDHLTQIVLDLHQKIGMDVNDSDTTWLDGGDVMFHPYTFDRQDEENLASAPMQTLLFLLLPLPLLIAWGAQKTYRRWPMLALIAVVTAQFLVFCFVLKWQVWHVRMLMALPAMFAPAIAWAWTTSRTKYAAPLIVLALLAGLYPSINSIRRPLWGQRGVFHYPYEASRYYQGNFGQIIPRLADQIAAKKPAVVAFDSGVASLDYNLMRTLIHKMSPPPFFTNINPALRIAAHPDPTADLIVRYGNGHPPIIVDQSNGIPYRRFAQAGAYALYARTPPRGASARPNHP